MKASRTQDLTMKQVIDNTHPPVVRRYALPEGAPAYEAGQIVGITKDSVVPYAEAALEHEVEIGGQQVTIPAVSALGVVTQATEQGADGVNLLIHGTAVRESLITADDTAADDAAVSALELSGIWAL